MFIFGGLVLDIEKPRPFEDDWKAAIAPLSLLHTSPFLAGTGGSGYERWNSKGLLWKQELLRKAARVIGRHALATFSTVLDMADFRKFSAEQSFDRAVAYPYALCARMSVVQIGHWSMPNSIPGRVKLLFENRSTADKDEVVKVFQRDHLKIPDFGDKSMAPLQAADLIAVIYARKVMKKPNFIQVQPAYAELNQMLHTKDILGYAALTSMWNRIAPKIITRPTAPGEKTGIYFQSDLNRPRKSFR